MITPKISVVMATYNGEKFIAEAIDSILNQTFTDFEFIIVNDGSTDATESIIESYNDPRIINIKKVKNSGIADSLNTGIAQASGEYIARMDDDDISYPNRLMLQYTFLKANTEYILCCANIDWSHKKNDNPKLADHEELIINMLFGNPIVHPTVMIRKFIFSTFSYNPHMVPSEDYDLWSRIFNAGKMHCLKSVLVLYRFDSESETTIRRSEQLKLNVKIAKRLFQVFYHDLESSNGKYIEILSQNDYSINGKELYLLSNWVYNLKNKNDYARVLNNEKFNQVIDTRWRKYLKSYFANKILRKKLHPFLKLKLEDKVLLIKHYMNF
ncbi:Glycosyltransferase involved in cell wall bisynthesis [Flavobacteriaceae bacterium MAR_2010_188]|nr:Glycosyltransferase involved in cell wall bisynthesis [Flavobacteriaceae bacterium MAR_2010_188]